MSVYGTAARTAGSRREERGGFFYRVNRVCAESAILVENTGKVLARYKREHLAPGEMEHITVPRMLLEKAQGAVRICVEEELR